MYDILLISHGPLAKGLVGTMEMILGEQPLIATCCLDPGEPIERYQADLELCVQAGPTPEARTQASPEHGAHAQASPERGLLVLCDLANGSPYRCALSVLAKVTRPHRIVSGVNLPMLVEAYFHRSEDLETGSQAARTAGISGVLDLGEASATIPPLEEGDE